MALDLSKKARAFLIENILGVGSNDDGTNEAEPASRNSINSSSSPVPAAKKEADIKCDLARPELWQQFSQIGTEMIITKAGRRMFPTMQVQFSGEGINAASAYLIIFEIVPASGKRFRYSYLQSSWTTLEAAAGSSTAGSKGGGNYFSKRATASDFGRETVGNKFYVHPECPVSGKQLVTKTFSFERIKLTNNESLAAFNDHVVLKSMHQYEPRVHLIELSSDGATSRDPQPSVSLGSLGALPPANTVWTFNFGEARFMAVTAYQNQLITKLKIDNNPFAKGFRKISRFSVAQVHLALGSAVNELATASCSGSSQVMATSGGALMTAPSPSQEPHSLERNNNRGGSHLNRRLLHQRPARRLSYWEKFNK